MQTQAAATVASAGSSQAGEAAAKQAGRQAAAASQAGSSGQASRSSQADSQAAQTSGHPAQAPRHPCPDTLAHFRRKFARNPAAQNQGLQDQNPTARKRCWAKIFGVWCDLFCMTHNLVIISVWLWTTFDIVHHSHERLTLYGTLAGVQESPSAV